MTEIADENGPILPFVVKILGAGVALLIGTLITVVAWLLAQNLSDTNTALKKIPEDRAVFQEKIITEIGKISRTIAELGGEFKATTRELIAHKEEDRTLRQIDRETIGSFERRLLTIERNANRSGLNVPLPSQPEDILRRN